MSRETSLTMPEEKKQSPRPDLLSQVNQNLALDNVKFFQGRYFSLKNLIKISAIAADKFPNSNCSSYLNSEVERVAYAEASHLRQSIIASLSYCLSFIYILGDYNVHLGYTSNLAKAIDDFMAILVGRIQNIFKQLDETEDLSNPENYNKVKVILTNELAETDKIAQEEKMLKILKDEKDYIAEKRKDIITRLEKQRSAEILQHQKHKLSLTEQSKHSRDAKIELEQLNLKESNGFDGTTPERNENIASLKAAPEKEDKRLSSRFFSQSYHKIINDTLSELLKKEHVAIYR